MSIYLHIYHLGMLIHICEDQNHKIFLRQDLFHLYSKMCMSNTFLNLEQVESMFYIPHHKEDKPLRHHQDKIHQYKLSKHYYLNNYLKYMLNNKYFMFRKFHIALNICHIFWYWCHSRYIYNNHVYHLEVHMKNFMGLEGNSIDIHHFFH